MSEVDNINYLGISLETNLSWKLHLETLLRKFTSVLCVLYKLKNKMDEGVKYASYLSLIQNHLDYLDIIYAYKKNNTFKSMQFLQNKTLRLEHSLSERYSTLS